MGKIVLLGIVVLMALASCTSPPPPPTTTPASTATSTFVPTSATQLASHMFVPVGESRSIDGLGELLETIHLTEPSSMIIEETTLTATGGSLSCSRFAYRQVADENSVQTLCVVSFDETGDCSGLDSITLDLQRFLGPTQEPVGNANLLEYGKGLLYAACRTTTGAYRLQQTVQPVPPLYFTIVDALGDGPYSLGEDELAIQRAGSVGTFSGTELRPSWIITVSREIDWLRLTDDLRIEFNDEDCSVMPSCTFSPEVVQPGDILRISVGVDGTLIEALFAETPLELRDRFFRERIGLGWSEIASVHPDARQMAFNRLVVLDIMGDLIAHFDDLYGLREKGVAIGYWQPWPAQIPLPYPYMCFPDDLVPGEHERCRRIELAIQAEEERRITQLREAGYDLWHANFIDYREEGQYSLFSDLRPHFSLFGGVIAGFGANSTFQVPDIPATLAAAMQQFAAEVGPETPVILSLNGPPITAQTGGAFCEADICPSDFKGTYEQIEAALHAALESISLEQLRGFGVALFEGAHFDIRQPYENFPGFSLNRVGETGYNNPVLNIYRAQ